MTLHLIGHTAEPFSVEGWPKVEIMAMLACKCHEPEHWQNAKDGSALCARCAFMIRCSIETTSRGLVDRPDGGSGFNSRQGLAGSIPDKARSHSTTNKA
jgi:hypothetical protein